jgi:hypothetical protein
MNSSSICLIISTIYRISIILMLGESTFLLLPTKYSVVNMKYERQTNHRKSDRKTKMWQ